MNIEIIRDWLYSHTTFIIIVSIISVVLVTLLFTALLITILRLPVDFFLKEERSFVLKRNNMPFILYILILILKNILGIILIIFGLIMILLPGQGVMAIFVAVIFVDFPGKWKMVRYFSGKKKIMQGLNWVRRLFKKSEFATGM